MKRLTASLILGLIAALCIYVPVQAETLSDPDGAVSINYLWVNQDLLEDGDMFIFFEYYIPYTTPPDVTADNAFLIRLYDSTNTTYLASAKIYAFSDNGYNYGVSSFYFSADDNPGWGEDYYIHISESPVYFTSPTDSSFALADINYTILDGQESNRIELKDKLIEITEHLTNAWSIALLDQSDAGKVLSTYGELYYRSAIPQLQYICPDIFLYQVADPQYTARTWSGDYINTLENQWDGTPYEAGFAAIGGLFGVDTMIIGSAIVVILCIIVVGLSVRKVISINAGLMDCYPVILISSLFGLFPLAIACFIDFLAWMYLGYIVILRR